MPLIQRTHSTDDYRVWIWHIQENLDFFLDQNLTENSQRRIKNMKSESHKKGFLAVRKLLEKAGYSDTELYYDELGKPHLKNGAHISISHSFEYSTIIIAPERTVGIDIEKIRPKISKIAQRFQSEDEGFIASDDYMGLTRLWACKEALFKTYIGGGLAFKKDIPIKVFNNEDSKTSGEVIKNDFHSCFDIHFINLPGYALAYAVNR